MGYGLWLWYESGGMALRLDSTGTVGSGDDMMAGYGDP